MWKRIPQLTQRHENPEERVEQKQKIDLLRKEHSSQNFLGVNFK